MKNLKFRRAAQLRKVAAFFLTISTFLGLFGLMFFQSDFNSFSEITEMISNTFLGQTEEVPSVNYP